MLKPKHTLITLVLLLSAVPLTAQKSPKFSSEYLKPATYGGLFYVQRHGWIVMDPEDGDDPRALVLSYNNNPIEPLANHPPDAPTLPGFYLSFSGRFDFERVKIIRRVVQFKTVTMQGVHYQFSGTIGSEVVPYSDPFLRVQFIKGILTGFRNRKIMSQEEIKFVHW